MTKHRSDFATVTRPDVPASEALVAFVNRWQFIIATPRTKARLDVLAKAGVLKRRKRIVKRDSGESVEVWRYTPKE